MELDFDEPFHPAYGVFDLEPNTYIFYRGFDSSYPIISERPAYYGTHAVAKSYADKHGTNVQGFTNSRTLKLLDVRFMKDILRHLFESTPIEDNGILSTILSFGLCSLSHQIELAKIRFKTLIGKPELISLEKSFKHGLIEQQGFRIAETTNDSYTMAFLKELFHDFVDGFVSPQMYSPFHIDHPGQIMIAEMIIFNPLKSGIIISPKTNSTSKFAISRLYDSFFGKKIRYGTPKLNETLYLQKGGGETWALKLPTVEEINKQFETEEIQKEWNAGIEAGKRWNKIARFGTKIFKPLCVEVCEWPISNKLNRNKTMKRPRK